MKTVIGILRGAGVVALVLLVVVMNGCGEKNSAAPAANIGLKKFAGPFNHPVHLAHAGDGSGRIFVVEQKGRILVIKNGRVLRTPFLDITDRVKSTWSEQGLLSVAFPPGFRDTKRLYVNYTSRDEGDTVIERYQVGGDPDVADRASAKTILTIKQPYNNHNGGQIAFGPDGLLYIGTGDGGRGGDPHGYGQSVATLLGKMLRIDVESGVVPYGIPKDNPFVGKTGHRPELWATGLRNPWRFSFDRKTGDLYIADVGQNKYEEVNVQLRTSRGGENYGWNLMEGDHCFRTPTCVKDGLVRPVAEYGNPRDGCSVTGGFVYRGGKYPAAQGTYVYGDFCSGSMWGLQRSGRSWTTRLLMKSDLAISTFGEDEAGNLYVADYSDGIIYEIQFNQ